MSAEILPLRPRTSVAELNATRAAWSQTKRALKSGTMPLAAALDEPCARNRTVLEVLGYAVIGRSMSPDPRRSYPGTRAPQPGQVALGLAQEYDRRRGIPGLTHIITVKELTSSDRQLLCQILDESGYATALSRSRSA